MQKKLLITLLMFALFNFSFGQNSNMIIQVNDKLVTFEISGMHLVFENNKKEIESTQINYIPGELIISDYAWGKINSDSTKKITLKFNYNTYKKNRQKIGNFQVDLTKTILEQPYVILNIYDFRNRKYKRWYQYLTEKDFLAELRYPNSGIYARQK